MKNEAEIIWWKTVKQDVETTPRRFTGAARVAARGRAVGRAGVNLDDKNIFKRVSTARKLQFELDGFTVLPANLDTPSNGERGHYGVFTMGISEKCMRTVSWTRLVR